MNNKCPCVQVASNADQRIKDYQQMFQSETDFDRVLIRELLRDDQAFKKRILKVHTSWCIYMS